MRNLGRWVVIGVLAFLVAGCTPAALPISAPHGESGEGYDVVDDQGTVVHLPHKPQRIMTAHFHLDCMLLGIVREERVISVTATLDRADVSYAAPGEFSKPRRNMSVFPSMEYIAALQPDLLFVRSSFGEDKIRSCRDIGIPVYVSEIPRNFDELKAKIRGIAEATREASVGEALIATAMGLCVAIIALSVHAYFTQRIESIVTDMEQCFSLVEGAKDALSSNEGAAR